MEIQINGKRIAGTKQQLMLKTLTARAAAGNVGAIGMLINLVMQVFGPEDRGEAKNALSAQDQQILDELLGRGRSSTTTTTNITAGPPLPSPTDKDTDHE